LSNRLPRIPLTAVIRPPIELHPYNHHHYSLTFGQQPSYSRSPRATITPRQCTRLPRPRHLPLGLRETASSFLASSYLSLTCGFQLDTPVTSRSPFHTTRSRLIHLVSNVRSVSLTMANDSPALRVSRPPATRLAGHLILKTSKVFAAASASAR
jgi:hypothetical protein